MIENGDLTSCRVCVMGNVDSEILQALLSQTSYEFIRMDENDKDMNKLFNTLGTEIYGFTNFIDLLKDKQNNFNEFKELYRICQMEANYYINNNRTGKIVNAIRISDINNVEANYSKCLTEGLASALGNHGISVNGIILNKDIGRDKEAAWIIYLLSRFGAVISGQVVTLGTTEENLQYNFPQTF